jgi:hypothetical protein
LAVQPMSPIFLYARGRDDLAGASTAFADELHGLQEAFRQLVGVAADNAIALVLRIAVSEPASVRSLRDFSRVNLP